MKIYKRVFETINGINREFVMIDIDEFNNYMLSTPPTLFNKIIKKEEKQSEAENKRIEEIKAKQKREEEREEKQKQKIETEIMVNKHENERINKIKEEIKEEYKDVFKTNENAKIKKCGFCSQHRVYPNHFLNEDNKPFYRSYTKDKQQLKATCCVDCFMDLEEKKQTRKTECSIFCNVCQCSYIAYNEGVIIEHNKSIKHKTILKIQKENKQKELKPTVKLELLKIKDLQMICSKTLNEQGTYLINNYSKTKKEDLIKKMYDVYDKLKFE
jgi:hypothetical protein